MKDYSLDFKKVNTVIVGSGAAGFNAACRLWQYGQHDILLISENLYAGTSRNTGSDKQTYYKLTLSGDTNDSVYEMAQTLFEGKCMDGDIALCEAAYSVPCFMRLCELGVEFPVNRYGEYIGYKTDHDPKNRATSVGPYTSKRMTEALQKQFEEYNIPFWNKLQVIKIIADDKKVYGLVCLDLSKNDEKKKYVVIEAENVVYATGGPAGIYANTVYPASQHGSSGLAFEAGVKGKNLTEWQFGLASVKPRWNVSGTYMQVLPKVLSTDKDLNDSKEFLLDYFETPEKMASKLFLKGYQWPFDARKVSDGSSIIDILVYLELLKGRRIFLDYRDEPNSYLDLNKLDYEAFEYLKNANALVSKPIERLKIMNQPAIDFYRDFNVDLETEMLEISLCAQHNNGGLDIDLWWQSNLKGFFPVGEVAGTHGVYRPGGSALNSGQVGSNRAALYISKLCTNDTHDSEQFKKLSSKAVEEMNQLANDCLTSHSNLQEVFKDTTNKMSSYGGIIRNQKDIEKTLAYINNILANFSKEIKIASLSELSWLYKIRDNLIAQKCYLTAYKDYIDNKGGSRGSALYTDATGNKPYNYLPDEFTFRVDDQYLADQIQTIQYIENQCICNWRPVINIPENDDFFENTWKSYRENGNVF